MSVRYGKFLSLEEVKEIVQPHPQDIKVMRISLVLGFIAFYVV